MLRKIFHPLYLKLAKPIIKHKIEIIRKEPVPKGIPIIFAANHSTTHDVPIVLTSIKKHTYVLADDVPRHTFDGLLFFLNGVVWVTRGDRQSGKQASFHAISLLKRKKNLLIFPEGTWNTSENLLLLPFHKGVIDIAKESSAVIVPVVLDYDKKSCRVVIGELFKVDKTSDSVDEIARLRDVMATLKWELIEANAVNRADVNKEDYHAYVNFLRSEWTLWDTEREAAAILKLYPTPAEVFAHLEQIEITKDNAFLLRPR